MTPSDQAAVDQRATAGLLDWTRAQLGWLRDARYEEADAIVVRSRFSLWYVKPTVAVVGVSVDRARGEANIRLGPDEGVEPAWARVLSLRSTLAARGISVPAFAREEHLERIRAAGQPFADVVDELRKAPDAEQP